MLTSGYGGPTYLMPESRRILLVDDNPGDALLVRLAVQELDELIEVYVVSNGVNIFDALEQHRPNLMLLDLNLPAKSGLEILAEIRSHHRWRATPVLVFTTSASRSDVALCYGAGANGYLLKPNDLNRFGDAVLRTVEYWFKTVELPTDPVQPADASRA